MVMPKFLIGERVKCEESFLNPGYPRWMWSHTTNNYLDYGASSTYLVGTVTLQDPTGVMIRLDNGLLHTVLGTTVSIQTLNHWFAVDEPIQIVAAAEKPKAQYSIHHGYFKQLYDEGLFNDVESLIKSNKSRA